MYEAQWISVQTNPLSGSHEIIERPHTHPLPTTFLVHSSYYKTVVAIGHQKLYTIREDMSRGGNRIRVKLSKHQGTFGI